MSTVRALLAGLILAAGLSAPAHAGQVRFGGEGHVFHPVFSRDGRYIAFEVNRLAGQVDLYVAELKGDIASEGRRVALPGTSAFGGGDVVAANPAWHPDNIVVFEGSNPGGQYRLYYFQPNGGAAMEMIGTTELPGHITFPAVSEDGRTMAFVAKQTGNGDIRTRDTTTAKIAQVTSTPATESFPLFSPDGRELLFTRRHAETEDIFLVKQSDGTERMITGGPGDQSRPTWARAGERIVYFDNSRAEGEWDLISVDLQGGDAKRLAKAVALPHRARPAISPNGEWVAYTLDDPQRSGKILLTKVDGSTTVEIDGRYTACAEPALAKQGDRVLLAYTALPQSGAEWRFLTVMELHGDY